MKDDRPSGRGHDHRNMKAKITDDRNEQIEHSGGVKLPAPLSNAEDEAFELIKLNNTTITNKLKESDRNLLSSLSDRVKIRTSHAQENGIDLIIINSGYASEGYFVCPDWWQIRSYNGSMAASKGHDRPYAADAKSHKEDEDYDHLNAIANDFCKTRPMASDGMSQLYLE